MFSSYSFWASSSLDVPAGVTQGEGHVFIDLPSVVRTLIFLGRRIQPLFLSLVDREVEFLCNDSIVLHYYSWALFILFIFREKNPVYRDQTHVPTCQKVTRLPLSYRGDRPVVVVVVFTLTDRASAIPSNIRGCQSGTWSQRGTKVNGSHHGDDPLLRPTGIQIATKSYATLQAMAPTNSKTVHQTSFTPYREQPRSTRMSPTHDQRSQQQIGQIRSNQF